MMISVYFHLYVILLTMALFLNSFIFCLSITRNKTYLFISTPLCSFGFLGVIIFFFEIFGCIGIINLFLVILLWFVVQIGLFFKKYSFTQVNDWVNQIRHQKRSQNIQRNFSLNNMRYSLEKWYYSFRLRSSLYKITVIISIVFIGVIFYQGCFFPEVSGDALTYHLPTAEYLATGEEKTLPALPESINDDNWQIGTLFRSSILNSGLFEMGLTFIYLFAQVFGDMKDPETIQRCVQFIPPIFGIIAILLVKEIAILLKINEKIAIITVFTVPVIMSLSMVLYSDIIWSTYVLFSFYSFFLYQHNNQQSYITISMISFGFAILTKILALFTLIFFVGLFFNWGIKRADRLKDSLYLLISLPFLLLTSARNIKSFGQPFHPYFTSLIGFSRVSSADNEVYNDSLTLLFIICILSIILLVFLSFSLGKLQNWTGSPKKLLNIWNIIEVCMIGFFLLVVLVNPFYLNYSIKLNNLNIINDLIRSNSGFWKKFLINYMIFAIPTPGGPHSGIGPIIFSLGIIGAFYWMNNQNTEKKWLAYFMLFRLLIQIRFSGADNYYSVQRYLIDVWFFACLCSSDVLNRFIKTSQNIQFSTRKRINNLNTSLLNLRKTVTWVVILVALIFSFSLGLFGPKGYNNPFYYPLIAWNDRWKDRMEIGWRTYEVHALEWINDNTDSSDKIMIVPRSGIWYMENLSKRWEFIFNHEHLNPPALDDAYEFEINIKSLNLSYFAILNSDAFKLYFNQSIYEYLIDNFEKSPRFNDTRSITLGENQFAQIFDLTKRTG